MKRFALVSGLAALLVAGARPAAAEGTAEAKEVLAKAAKAIGLTPETAKYNGVTTKFKGKFSGAGLENADISGTQTIGHDKLRTDVSVDANGSAVTFLRVLNGTKGWICFNGNTEEMNKDQMDEAKMLLRVEQLAYLRGLDGKDVKLSTLPEAKVDGKAAVGVLVKSPGHADVSLYFDKDKGVLLKSETKGKDALSGEDITQVTTYSDHKKVGDLTLPHKASIKRNNMPFMDLNFSSITPLEKLEDKDFAKP